MENHLLNAETSINAGNIEEAEVHINRASLLLNDFKDNILLTIYYKVRLFEMKNLKFF